MHSKGFGGDNSTMEVVLYSALTVSDEVLIFTPQPFPFRLMDPTG